MCLRHAPSPISQQEREGWPYNTQVRLGFLGARVQATGHACSTEEAARKSTMGEEASACTSMLNAKRRPPSTRSNSALPFGTGG